MKKIRIYTDGSCKGNPGPGGWAWAVSKRSYARGSEPETTNNRMEMTAVIEAIRQYKDLSGTIVIVTDSAYVMNCFTENWHRNWTQSGYKKKTGARVNNWDLWSVLIPLVLDNHVRFEKIKGHSGDEMNDFVDHLAGIGSGVK